MHASPTFGLDWLLGPVDLPCCVVAAHPDDETLGAALVLLRGSRCRVVHVTDGAPREARLRTGAAARTREAYALARRRELLDALQIAGIRADRHDWLGACDQEASFALAELTRRLLSCFAEHEPAFAIVHAYEGGHPDHDAAAFIAHAAAELCARGGGRAPVLVEMTGYHAAEGRLVSGDFVPGSGGSALLRLSPHECARKQRMLACFASQAEVIAELARPLDSERYRIAPRYRFDQPPHAGPLHYERLGWPMRAARFCRLAREASRQLALGGASCRCAS